MTSFSRLADVVEISTCVFVLRRNRIFCSIRMISNVTFLSHFLHSLHFWHFCFLVFVTSLVVYIRFSHLVGDFYLLSYETTCFVSFILFVAYAHYFPSFYQHLRFPLCQCLVCSKLLNNFCIDLLLFCVLVLSCVGCLA